MYWRHIYISEGYSKLITYSVTVNSTHILILYAEPYIYIWVYGKIVYIVIYTYIVWGSIQIYMYVYVFVTNLLHVCTVYGARCMLENNIYMLKTYI